MRKFTQLFFFIIFLFSGLPENKGQGQLDCGSEILPKGVSPSFLIRHSKFESDYQKQINSSSFQSRSTKYTLPVVFHVIHNGGVENIADSQVLSGLQHLNDAFQNIGYYDEETGEDVEVQFCIAKRNPDDEATSGINHVQSPLTNLNKDSEDQALKNVIRWNTNSYINIWIVNEICGVNGCGVVGYAYFPSAHGSSFDGIVMEASYLGTSEANSAVLVHEMGHYLGLYHTFQGGCNNTNCLQDGDKVCDTPPDQSTVRVPCSNTTNTCSTDVNTSDVNNPFSSDQNDMINNYMDYSNLECYSAFTQGQKDRMHFSIENQRSSLLDSKACLDPCMTPLDASISVSNSSIIVGETVSFNSTSNGATSFQWLINGQSFSNSQNANYTFAEEGKYTITLVVNNLDPNCEETISIDVTVKCPVVAAFISSGNDIKPGEEITLSNISQNATSYQWLVNGMPVSMNFNYSSIYSVEGTYDVQLIASNGLCSDTTGIQVITVSESGIVGTGLPIWPFTSTRSNHIETINWENNDPVVDIISEDGDNPSGQTGVGINACGELSFFAIHTGSSDQNQLNLYLPDGTVLLSEATLNGPGLNGVRGNNEIQVVRVPTYSNEWYIIYSEWSTDNGAPISNAAYNAAKILYSRVRLDDKKNLTVVNRDVELPINGTSYTYTDGKAVSRTAYGNKDQHFLYACRRSFGSSSVSIDRFLINDTNITWEKNTGTVSVPWWYLTIAGSPIELSPTEDRIAVTCRNQDKNRPDVLIFNTASFSNSDYISISAGELILVADGTSNDYSSVLPYSDKVSDLALDNNLDLRFLRNYERKLSRIEFSPNGRFLYMNTGGYNQGGQSNLTYLSQIDLESNPMEVRMQIQTPPDGNYDPTTGIGCSTSNSTCLDAYPAIGEIQSSYNGKLYFTKRHDNKFYVIPNPNDVLPQRLAPGTVDLQTPEYPNLLATGTTGPMPDQIDGHNYTDERFTSIEFNVNALDCNGDCLSPYGIELYLGEKLIESFIADECPDTFDFCGDTTKVYSLYSPLINLTYDSAIIHGSINYPATLDYFDFSDLTGCIELCDNNIDDDNDGLIDCDDPDLQDSCCCYIPPILELGPDIETCANGVYTLFAGESFVSYKWSDLTSESSTTVYEPGKYWVEVIDSCGQSQTDTIQINWSPITQVDLGQDIVICNGESIDLSVSGFNTYEWSSSSGVECDNCETITINPDTTTTYFVVVGKEGCYSVDSVVVFVSDNTFSYLDTAICDNEIITIGNVDLQVGDTQTFFFSNSVGCDSTLEVTVSNTGFNSYQEYIDTLICDYESFNFGGIEYGAYEKDTLIYQSINGCDSIYYLNIGGIVPPTTRDTLQICYGQSIEIFGNLESVAGEYTNVFSAAGFCDSTHITTLIINEEIQVSSASTASCYNEPNGSIDLEVSGGSGTYTYEWNNNSETSPSIIGLDAGAYEVTITDGNNCQKSITVVVDVIPEVELEISSEGIICFGEQNGVIDLSNNSNTLVYSLDNENYSENTLFDSLEAGSYMVYATDQYGCLYTTTTEIYQQEEIFVQLPSDTTIAFGASFIIVPNTNSEGELTYFWPESAGLDCNDCNTPNAQPFEDILYTLEVVDENGCVAKDEILVRVSREEQVFIPNIFSPNGDNINDYFFPYLGPGVKSIIKMDVYDRWGGLMYENSSVNLSTSSKGWDGTCNGKLVNPGVFVYIIEVEYIDGTRDIRSGDITIVR